MAIFIPSCWPGTVQEAIDLTYGAFPLAEKYRTVVVIAADGSLGQMMEPAEYASPAPMPYRGWNGALGHAWRPGAPKRIVTSLYLNEDDLEDLNRRLQAKLRQIAASRTALGRIRDGRR